MPKAKPSQDRPEDVAKRLDAALQRGDRAFISALMKVLRESGRDMRSTAKEIGIDRITLYKYEWGRDRPSLKIASKITAALGMKLTVVPGTPRRRDHKRRASNLARSVR